MKIRQRTKKLPKTIVAIVVDLAQKSNTPGPVKACFYQGLPVFGPRGRGVRVTAHISELRMQDPIGLGAAAVGACVLGFGHTHPPRTQDADKEGIRPSLAGLVHQADQGGEMHLGIWQWSEATKLGH